jgi:predicted kinase
MPSTRLELALKLIEASDWRAFEKFASEFLAPEYPSFRTTATAAGDGGRDGEIYVVDEDPSVAFQFSVTADWKPKISQTITRLQATFPSVTELIYVTNQTIGASADEIKGSMRKASKISLDVRDRHWFVEREFTYPARAVASERLAEQFVNPLLARSNLAKVAPQISGDEGRIALLQLTLDAQDGESDRNLTKSCFESLTIATLRGTSAEKTMSRKAVQEAIQILVPVGVPGQVDALVSSALDRLSKKNGPIKMIRATEQFHLSFEESKRLGEQTAAYILTEGELEVELADALCAIEGENFDRNRATEVSMHLREILESVLLRRGEAFAGALQSGISVQLDAASLLDEIRHIARPIALSDTQVSAVILQVLDGPSERMSAYLRRLSDSYTLFAFLRQTPDVQKVVLSIFAEGDIWLDTSAILPLIGETLVDDPTRRHYTQLIRSAIDAGLRLFATPGVIEEVERHLNRCVAFVHSPRDTWNGRVPFIYSAYILSGRSSVDFVKWQEQIRGRARPEEDVRDYLEDVFSIKEFSLETVADAAPIELRAAVQELWMQQHDRRRGAGDEYSADPGTISRLVAHDVENTVGVIQLRNSETRSPMGYKSWWLTMDKVALRLKSYLEDRMGSNAPSSSPALSPDFLNQLFRLGPMRKAVEKELHVGLPVMTDISRLENVPRGLIDLADRVRAENSGLDERLIRRKVRDTLDAARAKQGPVTVGGIKEIEEGILGEIARQETV